MTDRRDGMGAGGKVEPGGTGGPGGAAGTVGAVSTGRPLIGGHPGMQAIERSIEQLSRLDTSVLIAGESGTGKELVARAIHERGPRAAEPFVGVNCGAFTRSLLEDQLFGHRKGAFTGALDDRPGVFRTAGRGTLFLDEIGEMDLDLQGRLLRAIQEREVTPLGSNLPEPWHARLIVATNRDIEALVEAEKFRRDLFYRINVVQIRIPPLRERKEDIPALCEHFLDGIGERSGLRKRISPEARERLLAHDYPGNVRELRNAIERACALGESDVIGPPDLPPQLQETAAQPLSPLSQVEREHVVRALRLAGGQKKLAARYLQIDRNRLSRLIKRHGIRAEEIGGSGLN